MQSTLGLLILSNGSKNNILNDKGSKLNVLENFTSYLDISKSISFYEDKIRNTESLLNPRSFAWWL